MMNPTDLDVRILNHAARVEHAERFGCLYPAAHPEDSRPQRLLATLLRLSVRLTPEQTRQGIARDTATTV